MAASSYSSLLLLFLVSLLSTAFMSMHGFNDDPLIQQVVSSNGHDDLLTSAEHQFLAFKKEYGKSYPTQEEDDYRFGVFISNLRQARRNQIDDPTAFHGVTKFSDLTLSEFRRNFGSGLQFHELPHDVKLAPPLPIDDLPEVINWTDENNKAVTEVKDQCDCNGCWAFATIAVIEGAHYKANKELLSLSAQQLIDCSEECVDGICNDGCQHGHRFAAFKYVNYTGVVREEDYEFHKKAYCNKRYPIDASIHNYSTSVEKRKEDYPFGTRPIFDRCQVHNGPIQIAASIHNYSFIEYDEDQYAKYLQLFGPLAVSIDIDWLKDYKGDISCPTKKSPEDAITRHAVALVGYDRRTKPRHWLVKNSFGKNWGENGYFKICEGALLSQDMAVFAVAKRKPATTPAPASPSRQIN